MSAALVALLVYTVGVKCRGINKKEHYAAEHMFSVSETTANKIIKHGFMDLVKHNKTHLVRVYPKTLRLSSTNYLPHRYWAAGLQLVAINWQTFGMHIPLPKSYVALISFLVRPGLHDKPCHVSTQWKSRVRSQTRSIRFTAQGVACSPNSTSSRYNSDFLSDLTFDPVFISCFRSSRLNNSHGPRMLRAMKLWNGTS